MSLFAARAAVIGTENAFKIGPYVKEVEDQGSRVIKCNLGEPDFKTPAHIVESIKKHLDLDMTHYCDPQGIMPLREAIAKDVAAKRGITVTPDRVVVFPGAKTPIGLCEQTYCDPGDEVIYPSPGYPIYESFTRYVGARPVPLHLEEKNGFSFTGDQLEPLISKRTKMIVVNFPSNPTGGVADHSQLESIAAVIRDKAPKDVRIYADEVYENILFDGSVHQSIAALPGMEERSVIVSGVSKSFSWTGGRIGWAVFPTVAEANMFKNLNINYFACVPAYNQMGAVTGLESPLSKPEIDRMVTAFQERRDVVVSGLNAIPGVTCQKPLGAFYVFPNIGGLCESLGAFEAHQSLPEETRQHSSPATLFQMFLLFRYQVATVDRRSFGEIGAEGKHFLRLSIATGLDDLKEALARIAKAGADRGGFAAFVKEGKHLY